MVEQTISLVPIIEWLNINSGALTVIITLVYVAATVLIWLANYKSAQVTHDQLEESKRQFEETKKANKQQLEAMQLQLEESKRQYAETKRLEMMPYLQLEITGYYTSLVPKYMLITNDNYEEQFDYMVWCSSGVELKNIGRGVAKDILCYAKDCKPYNRDSDFSMAPLQPKDIQKFNLVFTARGNDELPQSVSFVFIYKDLLNNSYKQSVDIFFRKNTIADGYRVNNCIVHLPELIRENQEITHA